MYLNFEVSARNRFCIAKIAACAAKHRNWIDRGLIQAILHCLKKRITSRAIELVLRPPYVKTYLKEHISLSIPMFFYVLSWYLP